MLCEDIMIEKLVKLKFVFDKIVTVIVGNVLGLNDGGVVFVLMSEDRVK